MVRLREWLGWRRLAVSLLVGLWIFPPAGAEGAGLSASQPASGPARIVALDTTGFWRMHQTQKPPVVRAEGSLRPLLLKAACVDGETAPWGFQGEIRNITAGSWELLFARLRPRRYGPR